MNRKQKDNLLVACGLTTAMVMLAGFLWGLHWVFSQVPLIISVPLMLAVFGVQLLVGLCGLLAALLSR